jgi:spermidine/putrescine transport system ATP-binding protein
MLELDDLYKTYEDQPLLRGISFNVGAKETICLLGASGSGKSTLLRMIAGLELPDSGRIMWDGEDLASMPAHLRDFGLVFQDYALFPHLDVFDNVSFGLKMRSLARDEIEARVQDALSLVELNNFIHRKVTDLSGGEQQRVALARAIAPRPRLLMFDEPLGALDRGLKESLLDELRGILHQTRIPAIYVTHDQEEAFTIADRVLMLHEGKIVREGTPTELWKDPGSTWAAEFLGLGKLLEGRCRSRNVKSKTWNIDTNIGNFKIKCTHDHSRGDKVHLLLRPEQIDDGNLFRGKVTDVVFQQERYKVTIENSIYIYLPTAPMIGQNISVRVAVQCLG